MTPGIRNESAVPIDPKLFAHFLRDIRGQLEELIHLRRDCQCGGQKRTVLVRIYRSQNRTVMDLPSTLDGPMAFALEDLSNETTVGERAGASGKDLEWLRRTPVLAFPQCRSCRATYVLTVAFSAEGAEVELNRRVDRRIVTLT